MRSKARSNSREGAVCFSDDTVLLREFEECLILGPIVGMEADLIHRGFDLGCLYNGLQLLNIEVADANAPVEWSENERLRIVRY